MRIAEPTTNQNKTANQDISINITPTNIVSLLFISNHGLTMVTGTKPWLLGFEKKDGTIQIPSGSTLHHLDYTIIKKWKGVLIKLWRWLAKRSSNSLIQSLDYCVISRHTYYYTNQPTKQH